MLIYEYTYVYACMYMYIPAFLFEFYGTFFTEGDVPSLTMYFSKVQFNTNSIIGWRREIYAVNLFIMFPMLAVDCFDGQREAASVLN
jgi:hypothetical protein